MEELNYNPVSFDNIVPVLDVGDPSQSLLDANKYALQDQQSALQQMQANAQIQNANLKRRNDELAELAKLSQSAAKSFIDFKNTQHKQKMGEAFAEGMMAPPDSTEIARYTEQENAQKADSNAINNSVTKNLKAKKEVTATDAAMAGRVRNLTGDYAIAYANGRAQASMASYKPALQAFLNKVKPEPGAQTAAAIAEFNKKWGMQSGMASANKGYLAKYVYPNLQRDAASVTEQNSRSWNRQNSANQSDLMLQQLNSGEIDLATYFTRQGGLTTGDGKTLRTMDDAWNTLSDAELTPEQMSRLGSSINPTTGKPYSEHPRFKKLQLAARNRRVSEYRLSENERAVEFGKEERAAIDAFLDPNDADGYTDDQIEEVQQAFQAKYGYRSKKLDDMLVGSVEGKAREKQEEQIQDLQALGLLTPERLAKFDRKLQAKYMSSAMQQAKLSKTNGGYKSQLDIISDAVKLGPEGQPQIKITPGGQKHPSVGIMEMKMHQYFMKKVMEYDAAGNADPATAALNDTLAHFNSTAKVTKGGYEGVIAKPDAVNTNRIVSEQRLYEINEGLKVPGSLDKPFAFYDEAQLTEMIQGYGTRGWTPDASLTYIGSKLGLDPLTVLNRQLKAAGMDELEASPAAQIIQNELTPAQRNALSTAKSPSVSTRVMGSLGGFRPELVPGGYGEFVVQSASKHGVQPHHAAALLEIESTGNPNAVSRTGAIGLMQIQPDAHPGYTGGKDPAANIDYGVGYYSQLLAQFKDPVIAAGAYNAGPGRMQEYIQNGRPLPQETVDHMKKFSAAMYKYGGGTEALNHPTNMSPALAYITGNIGPTSTGPHLDVKQVGRGEFAPNALDEYVEVDDPELGRVPLSKVPITGDFASHTVRGSHGIDYGTYSGTKVYVKNGAKVVNTAPSEHGDVVTIQLPNGQQYTFLHGTKAS